MRPGSVLDRRQRPLQPARRLLVFGRGLDRLDLALAGLAPLGHRVVVEGRRGLDLIDALLHAAQREACAHLLGAAILEIAPGVLGALEMIEGKRRRRVVTQLVAGVLDLERAVGVLLLFGRHRDRGHLLLVLVIRRRDAKGGAGRTEAERQAAAKDGAQSENVHGRAPHSLWRDARGQRARGV